MYLFFITVLLLNVISCTVIIPNVQPSDCSVNEYFQFSSLRCVTCNSLQRKSSDLLSCTCDQGARIRSDFGGHAKSCTPCPGQEVVTDDGWGCVKCQTDADYVSTTKTCRPCSAGLIAVDKHEDGTSFARKKCLSCTGLTTPAGNSERVCKRCNQQILKVTSNTICSCARPGKFLWQSRKCHSVIP